jgi:hypothetical protein
MNGEHEPVVKAPRWVLLAAIPLVGLAFTGVISLARSDFQSEASAKRVEQLEADFRTHVIQDEKVRQDAARERYEMRETLLYLCLQRREDNARSGVSTATEC